MNEEQKGKTILIVGSTGVVGSHILYGCFSHPEVEKVITIDAKSNDIEHVKLTTLVHNDFLDFSAVAQQFTGVDAILYCIGAEEKQTKQKGFHTVTVDVTKAFMGQAKTVAPNATLCFLSAAGADVSGQSTNLFAKDRGVAERTVREQQFPKTYIFRPDNITPGAGGGADIQQVLLPIIKLVNPNVSVKASELAWAMISIGLGNFVPESDVLDNKDIRKAAKKHDEKK